MTAIKKWFFLVLLAAGVLAGCKEDPIPEPEPEKEEAPELTQKINSFIKVTMEEIYLWYKQMPGIDIRYEFDPYNYFDQLLYSEDKWSEITENATEFNQSSHGNEKSFGYSIVRGNFSNSNNYFALIEYVYPDSPADKAGLKRGDFIVKINGQDITESSYMNLYNAESISITTGNYTSNGIGLGNEVTMESENLTLNPVLLYKTIDKDGHKIGYLFYTQFIPDFTDRLRSAFQFFKENNVTDLIVDLRYNPGGYINAAQFLCYSIAPLSVTENSTLVKLEFNDKYSPIIYPFLNSREEIQPVRLGLNKVYFLTGQGSASASELTITGLDAYMDVVTVGDTTHGKYTASLFFTPDSIYNDKEYTSDIKDWGIQPIIAKYENANGITDFKNGFAPNFLVNEDRKSVV